MKESGISGWGMRPLSAKTPNTTVNSTAKTAPGMLRSWASAIVLESGRSVMPGVSGMCHSREPQICDHCRLIECKTGGTNRVECPTE